MKVKFSSNYSEILRFIRDFKCYDTGRQVTRTFTNGYCYWFAHILHTRFPKSEIVYYAVGNHFACKIRGHIFDITGDITNKNLFFESWEDYQKNEPLESERITKYCITKTGI